MSRRFSPEVKAWLQKYIPGRTARDVSAALYETFGIEMTPEQVNSYRKNNHIYAGIPGGVKKGSPTALFPAEVRSFISTNIDGRSTYELTVMINREFGTSYTRDQIRHFTHNNKLRSGYDARYKQGNEPVNKGKPMKNPSAKFDAAKFKNGNIPHNAVPVGTIVKKDDGYLWIKHADPNRWKQLHRYLWEKEHGPIPKGMVLTFLDGNKENVSLENLRLISKALNARATHFGYRFEDPDLTEAGLKLADLRGKISDKKKAGKKNAPDK